MEMVESVDDLKSSRSIRGTHGPDFELLDARIAPALNTIIQNTRFNTNGEIEPPAPSHQDSNDDESEQYVFYRKLLSEVRRQPCSTS